MNVFSMATQEEHSSCSSNFDFPQELVDRIIDLVSDNPYDLRSCSSVSRAWKDRSQSHIFQSIAFDSHRYWDRDRSAYHLTPSGLADILAASPHLGAHVHCLALTPEVTKEKTYIGPLNIRKVVGFLPNVRTIRLRGSTNLDDTPRTDDDALDLEIPDLLHMWDSMTDLSIENMAFPSSWLDVGSLNRLVLSQTEFIMDERGETTNLQARPEIIDIYRWDCLNPLPPQLDLSKISNLRLGFQLFDSDDAQGLNALLSSTASTLQHLRLHLYTAVMINPMIDLSRCSNLRTIDVGCQPSNYRRVEHVYAISWLADTLASLSSPSLTLVKLRVSLQDGAKLTAEDRSRYSSIDNTLIEQTEREGASIVLRPRWYSERGRKPSQDDLLSLFPKVLAKGMVGVSWDNYKWRDGEWFLIMKSL